MPLLEARALTKAYGGLIAVNEVSLAVEERTVTALIGPNGAGKSTFFKMLAGEIAPTSGTMVFNGADITHAGATRIAQLGIAKSYQITQIFPKLTVTENVLIPALAAKRGPFRLDIFAAIRGVRGVPESVESVLDAVGLRERAATRADDLSYGEKRRLEVALALACEPKLLLLDEPAAGMSANESHDIVALIGRLRDRLAIVIVEHDMDLVFGVADRIVVLQDGRQIAGGTPSEIRGNPKVQEAYLGGLDDDDDLATEMLAP